MKAMCIHAFGPANQFKMENVKDPVLSKGKVLIKVVASSINPIDLKIRSGLVPGISPAFPAILNGDVAGTVVATAEDVNHIKPGDRVFALGGGVLGHDGALGTYMSVDADLLVKIPDNITFETAALLPIVGLTAWEALVARGKLKEGQKVLIHGGAGGVGHIAIQLAKSLGAEVYTTVSSDEKAELALSIGANHVINYTKEGVIDYKNHYTNGKGFDLIFDTVGKDTLSHSFEAAALHGTVVTTNSRSSHDLSLLHSKALTLHVVFVLLPLLTGQGREQITQALSKIIALVSDNKIKPITDQRIFAFSEISNAHEYFESGKHIGKVLLINDLS